ncbi:MAG TPA: hypothetical protein VFL85_04385 [Candidatus Saccharimonadales bacterium]|nr:hypothetical protein [Candidatus Saccharimonadales bacterium]
MTKPYERLTIEPNDNLFDPAEIKSTQTPETDEKLNMYGEEPDGSMLSSRIPLSIDDEGRIVYM